MVVGCVSPRHRREEEVKGTFPKREDVASLEGSCQMTEEIGIILAATP